MTKLAELAGVAHHIAHHRASGLSCLSPHLAQARRSAGEETTAIELLAQNPYPANIAQVQPLRLSLLALKATVLNILHKHDFHQHDVLSIVLHATPSRLTHRAMFYTPEPFSLPEMVVSMRLPGCNRKPR